MPSERTLELLKSAPDPFAGRGYDPVLDELGFELWGRKMPPTHYDREGEPISMRQWTILSNIRDYRRVAADVVGPYHVSTIWLGIDHNFAACLALGREGYRPIVFESMVFENEISYSKPSEWFPRGFHYHRDYEQRRYSTEEEALEGHALLCEEIRLTMAAMADVDPRDLPIAPKEE